MAHEGSYKASLSLERPNLAWQKVSKIWFIKQFVGRDEEEEYKFLGKLFFEVSASVPSLILQHFFLWEKRPNLYVHLGYLKANTLVT